jgi:hypothetical protein
VSETELFYQFTIDDSELYTRPWVGEFSFHWHDGPIYEFACHEGNYSLPNSLRGGQAEAAGAPRRNRGFADLVGSLLLMVCLAFWSMQDRGVRCCLGGLWSRIGLDSTPAQFEAERQSSVRASTVLPPGWARGRHSFGWEEGGRLRRITTP